MGACTKTKNNPNAGGDPGGTAAAEITPEAVDQRSAGLSPVPALSALAAELGLPLPKMWEQRVAALQTSLSQFKINRGRWPKEVNSKTDAEHADRFRLKLHLAFTLFVPSGRADRARMAVAELAKAGVFDRDWGRDDLPALERRINGLIRSLVRFPTQKAGRLAKALWGWSDLESFVQRNARPDNPARTRHCVQRLVPGFGPKAAAHFMRNTGLMHGFSALPIIDTHIVKMITRLGFDIDPGLPAYGQYERHFSRLSRLLLVSPLLLDAVIWSAYSGNWNPGTADFDNFDLETEQFKQRLEQTKDM